MTPKTDAALSAKLAEVENPDWFLDLLALAIEDEPDIDKAIEIANAAYDAAPQPPATADDKELAAVADAIAVMDYADSQPPAGARSQSKEPRDPGGKWTAGGSSAVKQAKDAVKDAEKKLQDAKDALAKAQKEEPTINPEQFAATGGGESFPAASDAVRGGPGSGPHPGPGHGADEKAASLVARAKELPAKAWEAAKAKVGAAYQKLEAKYGSKMAVTIVAAGIVGTLAPLPGATLLATAPLIGAAELYQRISGRRDQALSSDEIAKLGKDWMAELLADWEENDLPEWEKNQ